MKKLLSLLLSGMLISIASFAQAPQAVNYQGIARSTTGAAIATAPIGLRLTITNGSGGTVLYQETQRPTTNGYGLYYVAIGMGTPVTGTFSAINWAGTSPWLEVEMDPSGGTSYTDLGTNPLQSVPYSMYAATAGTANTATTAGTITGTVPMGGDVTGTNAASTVVKLQGKPVSATAPTTGQLLEWNGSSWVPYTLTGGTGTVTSITAGTGLSGGTITTSGTISMPPVGTAGTYGTYSTIPVITTDAEGRVSGVTLATVSATGSSTVSGTANYISMFTAPHAIGNSLIYQPSGTDQVGINATTTNSTLQVASTTDSIVGEFYTTGTYSSPYGVVDGELDGTVPGTAVRGLAQASYATNNSYGVVGYGTYGGTYGQAVSSYVSGTFTAQVTGAEGDGYGADAYSVGTSGFAYSYPGTTPENVWGIYGYTDGTGVTSNYAGYFQGDVNITGTMYATSKAFKIDDPIDPDNKYLIHSCVESNDMMNIYNGNVTTDASGKATVTLPGYFEALNKDFRYQLTTIGSFAQAMISREVSGNTFEITTSTPNVKVSWMVTGVRQDAYSNAHRLPNEVEKESMNKGKYVDAKDLNKPANKQIGADYKSAKNNAATTNRSAKPTTTNKN